MGNRCKEAQEILARSWWSCDRNVSNKLLGIYTEEKLNNVGFKKKMCLSDRWNLPPSGVIIKSCSSIYCWWWTRTTRVAESNLSATETSFQKFCTKWTKLLKTKILQISKPSASLYNTNVKNCINEPHNAANKWCNLTHTTLNPWAPCLHQNKEIVQAHQPLLPSLSATVMTTDILSPFHVPYFGLCQVSQWWSDLPAVQRFLHCLRKLWQDSKTMGLHRLLTWNLAIEQCSNIACIQFWPLGPLCFVR